MQKWITTTDTQWQAAFKRDVSDVHDSELGKLKLQYLTSLDAAITKASGAGDLDGSLALRKEQKRFSDTNVFPEQDDAADAASVKQLRAAIRVQLARLEKDSATRAKALHAKYDQVLAQAQTQLTQRQRFDDAVLVKNKREEVAAAWSTPVVAANGEEAKAAKETQDRLTKTPNGVSGAVHAPATKPKTILNDPDRGWIRLFRSSEPAAWNTDVSVSENHFAVSLAKAPRDTQWLRMKRTETGGTEYVIIPMKLANLEQDIDMGKYTWNGSGKKVNGHAHLGIGNKKWGAPYRDGKVTSIGGLNGWGWGTSPPGLTYPGAAFAWKGQKGDLDVVDISVKTTALTTEESNHILK